MTNARQNFHCYGSPRRPQNVDPGDPSTKMSCIKHWLYYIRLVLNNKAYSALQVMTTPRHTQRCIWPPRHTQKALHFRLDQTWKVPLEISFIWISKSCWVTNDQCKTNFPLLRVSQTPPKYGPWGSTHQNELYQTLTVLYKACSKQQSVRYIKSNDYSQTHLTLHLTPQTPPKGLKF